MLVLTEVRLKDNNQITYAQEFGRAMAIINLVAIAQFFKAICTGIFKRLCVVGSTKDGLFGLVSTYFSIVETNG